MNILIFGCGSVGLGIGSQLLNAGVNIDFLGRTKVIELIDKSGIKLTTKDKEIAIDPKRFKTHKNVCLGKKKYEYIFITLKTSQLLNIRHQIEQAISDTTKIILFQNGWNSGELVAKELKTERNIYNAIIYIGFKRKSVSHVELSESTGIVRMGSVFKQSVSPLKPLSDILKRIHVGCELVDDIEKDIWNKILFNSSLNPTSAILNASYGELQKSAYAQSLVRGVIDETFNVILKSGNVCRWDSAEQYGDYLFNELLPKVSNHESSMLQDIKNRRETEIDFLNGHIIKLANQLNIPVPYNKFAFNSVKFLEQQSTL